MRHLAYLSVLSAVSAGLSFGCRPDFVCREGDACRAKDGVL